MKNSRLSGLIAFIIAILLVGGLTFYELTQNKPKETVASAPAASSETPAAAGDKIAVQPAAPAESKPAPAAGSTSAGAPTAPAAPAAPGTNMAAAPAKPSAPAAGTPSPAAGTSSPAETAANPPSPGADNQMAAAPAAKAPAANAAPATQPADQANNATPAAAPPPAANAPTNGNQRVATAVPSPAGQANNAAPAGAPAPADQANNTAPAGTPSPAANAPTNGNQRVATVVPPPTAAPQEKPGAANKPAASTMAAPASTIPSFDVVRVEPTGETVVAGQAAPGAKVDVLDGTAVVATATANDRGEWALALDHALKPGTHDLAIRMTSQDGAVSTLSDERVAVEVPKPGSKDVLVVVNTPDKPSRVLEMPKGTAPAASGGEQVASAAGKPPAGEIPTAAKAGPQTAKTGSEVAALEPKTPGLQSPDLLKSPEGQPNMAGSPPAGAKTPGETANAPAGKPAAPATAEAAPPSKPAKPAKPAPPTPEVAVSAVEADTAGTLYVAGTAKTGQTVRVYLDDKPLGEAKPSPSGTWLVEVHHEVPPGNYQVRADQISGSDGKVIARAEVPFDRKIDVASLKASGATAAATGADVSGRLPQVQTVIIKKGDNLWTIARNTWGRGITWSTLYQANKDQIRNPHWIYPGQVFVMPVSPEVAKQ